MALQLKPLLLILDKNAFWHISRWGIGEIASYHRLPIKLK